MINKIKTWTNNVFGPQAYELELAESRDKKIQSMLRTISTIRFFIFPLSAILYLTGVVLELIILAVGFVSHGLFWVFQQANDSIWLDPSWFGLTDDEIENELSHLSEGVDVTKES